MEHAAEEGTRGEMSIWLCSEIFCLDIYLGLSNHCMNGYFCILINAPSYSEYCNIYAVNSQNKFTLQLAAYILLS